MAKKRSGPKKVKRPDVTRAQAPSFASTSYPSAIGSSSSYDYGGSDDSRLNTGLTDEEANVMISAAKGDKTLAERFESDSLWKVVSKAYKRNLGKVLVLKSDVRRAVIAEEEPAKDSEISDSEKKQLQKLLENN